jgi:hypothetical protein
MGVAIPLDKRTASQEFWCCSRRRHPRSSRGLGSPSPELTVAIAGTHRSLQGVVAPAQISAAMQTLQPNCLKAAHGR